MKKLLVCLGLMVITATSANAAKIPDNIKGYVNKDFPQTNFRFDGVIILPDNTIYLPLFPAKILNPEQIQVKSTYPAGKTLADKPNVIIFNNDFVLLKVLTDTKGDKTVYRFANPPLEIKTGLLPQDMLVPKGLKIPDNMKGIIGNLEIATASDPGIKIQTAPTTTNTTGGLKNLYTLPPLRNKTFYVSSPYSKNIQVFNQSTQTPDYAFAQKNIPISMKAYDNKFLLVTSYNKPSVDVISLADDQIIKQIYTKTQPDEIVIDTNKKIAYISSSEDSSIYMVNLENMTLFRQIKIAGMCEKLTLSDDGSKLFYYDKKTRDIWAIELDNDYLLKEIGKFPNVSKIAFANNKIYITSRTKNHLAIIDYDTVGLIAEIETSDKPIDMLAFHDKLYILGATDNVIEVLDTNTDMMTDKIYLGTYGFSTKIYHIDGTNIALITDTKASTYTIFDLGMKKVITRNTIDTPLSSIVVTDKIKKINK